MGLAYPGRAPALNASHPAVQRGLVQLAAVSEGPSMVDLLTGVSSTNANVQGGVNEYGPYTVGRGLATGSFLVWPNNGPTTVNAYGLAAIWKAGPHHSNQALVSFNALNEQLLCTSTAIANAFLNTVRITLPAQIGHQYFAYTDWVGATPTARATRLFVMDMTAGLLFDTAGPSNGANLVITGGFNVLTGNVAGTPDEGQLAAAAVLTFGPAGRPWLSRSEVIDWCRDPFSLWYGADTTDAYALAGQAPASGPTPPAGNAVNAGQVTAHPIPWRRTTPLGAHTGARSSRIVYQPGAVPLAYAPVKLLYTGGSPLDRVIGFSLTSDNGSNGWTFTLRDRNTGDRFVFTHGGGKATVVAGSIATLTTEANLEWKFDGTNDSVVTLSFQNFERHPGHL